VTAGTTPDAIPNLPVVARMASLLGKRQHHQLGPMHGMPMVPPGIMYGAVGAAAAPASYEAASVPGGEECGSVMPSGAVAVAAAAGGEAGAEAPGAEERVSKQAHQYFAQHTQAVLRCFMHVCVGLSTCVSHVLVKASSVQALFPVPVACVCSHPEPTGL
jgi:hypothetical protein